MCSIILSLSIYTIQVTTMFIKFLLNSHKSLVTYECACLDKQTHIGNASHNFNYKLDSVEHNLLINIIESGVYEWSIH